MRTMARLESLLPDETGEKVRRLGGLLYEIRLRAGHPAQLKHADGASMASTVIDARKVADIAAALMDFSVYSREAELRQGFFTMPDGCRVGVCGRMGYDGERITGIAGISSLCIRVCREVRGCAERIYPYAFNERGALRSMLLLSAPGMGKTTLLRELARRISEGGRCVAIADERHELAACVHGVPTLDVGPCTDVLDGLPKAEALGLLLRAMAPEAIITDEIGGDGDAQAICEATRCGVAVIASAHAPGLRAALRRRRLGDALRAGCFDVAVILDGAPGRVAEICQLKNGEGIHAVCAGDMHHHGLHAVRKVPRKRRSQAN